MSSIIHTYRFQVKEHHLDTFGHVNNATYLQLFEEARWDWITKNEYGLNKIRSTGLGPVILDIQIAFKRELTLRQEIIINTDAAVTQGKISKLKQQMINSDGKVCCDALFSFGLFDTAKRKLVQPTEDWLIAISKANP